MKNRFQQLRNHPAVLRRLVIGVVLFAPLIALTNSDSKPSAKAPEFRKPASEVKVVKKKDVLARP